MVLVPAGQERREGVDHHELEAVLVVEGEDVVNEGQPLLAGGLAAEGPAEQAETAAEVEKLLAAPPEDGGLLGDNEGLAGGEGEAGQDAAGLQTGEQDGEQGCLAELPLAGKERDVAG